MNASLLPLLAGLILLTGVSCGPPSAPAGTQGNGTVIFPPAAGTAVFSARIGPSETDVVRTAVTGSGTYRVFLPPDPPLPAAGPTVLDLLGPALPDDTQAACQGSLDADPSAARVLVLSGGRYLLGTQVTGALRPAPQAIGAQQLPVPQRALVTTRQFVFSDRAVTLSGNQTCTFTRGDQVRPGTLQVRTSLRRGWNVLETRTDLTPDRVTVEITRTGADAAVDWRYLPRAD